MPLPYVFANAVGTIPLSNLDDNFNYTLNNGIYAKNSDVANTVLNPNQSIITTVGTLTSLRVDGATALTNVSVSNTVVTNIIRTDNYQYANGQPFSGGGSSTYGNANVAAYLASGNNVIITTTGNITSSGNISGAYLYGDGSNITGIAANYGNANVSNYLSSNSNVTITTTGNVTAAYFVGDGGGLANVGSYNNDNVAAFLPNYSGDIQNLVITGNLTVLGNSFAETLPPDTDDTQVATTAFVQSVVQSTGGYGNAQVSTYLSSGNNSAGYSTTGNIRAANYFKNSLPLITKSKLAFWVDPTNGNDSNDGSVVAPFQTIAHAQQQMNGSGETLNLFPGIYSENVTWTLPNINIVGPNLGGGAYLNGDWTFNTSGSVRVYGVEFSKTGFTAIVHNGSGGLYFDTVVINQSLFQKTGTGFMFWYGVDSDNSDLAIENTGVVEIHGGRLQGVTIAGGAIVNIQGITEPGATIGVDDGVLTMESCTLYGQGSGTTPAISTTANTIFVSLENSSIYNADGLPGTVNFDSPWSIVSTVLDFANSTLPTGQNLNRTAYFDSIQSLGDITGNVIGNVLGNVVGNITGDLVGNVTGDLVGNVTGDVVGNVTGNVSGNSLIATTVLQLPVFANPGDRDAITPVVGMMIYVDAVGFQGYDGTQWVNFNTTP